MNDLVVVEVFHPGRDLLSPVDQPQGGYFVHPLPEEVEEGSVGTVLHDDAVARGLGANASKLKEQGGMTIGKESLEP